MEYVNKDTQHRVWPSLQIEDGTTLELDPGEKVELTLPKGFQDPYLKPVKKKKPAEAKAKVESKPKPGEPDGNAKENQS